MLTLSQAAARAGVHVKTLQRLDRVGRLTATGRRWYAEADVDAFFGISPKQKPSDARPGSLFAAGSGTRTAGTKAGTGSGATRSTFNARRHAINCDRVTPRCRRHQSRLFQALRHDPELFVLRPTAATADLDDLEAFRQEIVRMAVHTRSLDRRPAPSQGGPRQTDTTRCAFA